jgi:enterochelin esterase-like enzyme
MHLMFTWQQDPEAPQPATRVYLHINGVHDHHDHDLHQMQMQEPGLWSTSVEVPDDLTGSYFVLPLTSDEAEAFDNEDDSRARWVRLMSNAVPHVLDHPGWRPSPTGNPTGDPSGLLIMPDAPERPGWDGPNDWDSGDEPAWEEHTLDGRTIWTSSLRDAEYVLVVSDGESWMHTTFPAALARLHDAGRLPTVGVVAVDTGPMRSADSERFGLLSRSQTYRDLIADSVLPWAWERVGRAHDPARTIIAGESLGGLAAVDLVLARPDAVAFALSNSGSFWFPAWGDGRIGGGMAEEIRDVHSVQGIQGIQGVHLSAGTGEGAMPDHSRAVADALEKAGVRVSTDIACHGHEMAGWTGAMTRGLIALLSPKE